MFYAINPNGNPNLIVGSHPGEYTGDTVFVTETGRELYVSCSSAIPRGYKVRKSKFDCSDYPTSRVAVAEPQESEEALRARMAREGKAKQIGKQGVGYKLPFKRKQIVIRPEYHARSNPCARRKNSSRK